MATNLDHSAPRKLDTKGTISRLVLSMCGAGMMAALVYLSLALNSIIAFGERGNWILFLSCFTGSLLVFQAMLLLFNRVATGAYYPEYKNGSRRVYLALNVWQSAFLGVATWGLPIAIPWATKAAIEASAENRPGAFLFAFSTWCVTGLLYGIIARCLQKASSDSR